MTFAMLIAIAAATNTTRYAAQCGMFFDTMEELELALVADGHQLQQNDGERVLVDHTAWITKHGVVHPLR